VIKTQFLVNDTWVETRKKNERQVYDLSFLLMGSGVYADKYGIKLLKDSALHVEMIFTTQTAAHLENERLKEHNLLWYNRAVFDVRGASIPAKFNDLDIGMSDTKQGLFNYMIEAVSRVDYVMYG